MTTHLTADEVTTLDEAWRASTQPGGSFLLLLDVVEEMVAANRVEAAVMAELTDVTIADIEAGL